MARKEGRELGGEEVEVNQARSGGCRVGGRVSACCGGRRSLRQGGRWLGRGWEGYAEGGKDRTGRWRGKVGVGGVIVWEDNTAPHAGNRWWTRLCLLKNMDKGK